MDASKQMRNSGQTCLNRQQACIASNRKQEQWTAVQASQKPQQRVLNRSQVQLSRAKAKFWPWVVMAR
jgi:hypothetical protein